MTTVAVKRGIESFLRPARKIAFARGKRCGTSISGASEKARATAFLQSPLRSVLTKQMLVAACTLLCFTGCKAKRGAASPPPPTVEVAAVTQADVPIYHEWIGVLDGLVNAQIRAQVAGYLLTQNYREGDPIRKGDMLFEIDPRPFQAALDQAKGLLAQAEARLGKTELDVKRNMTMPCKRTWRPPRRWSLPRHRSSRLN